MLKSKVSKPAFNSSSPVDKPPNWCMLIGRWFRLGIGIFLLLSVLFGTVGCSSSTATVVWQKASSVVDTKTVEQIVQQNTELNPSQAAAGMLAWNIKGKAGKLLLIDYNNSGVCGVAGCLYNGYLVSKNKQFSQVFSSYLNPHLSQNQPLFQIGERSDGNLPCLQVMQIDSVRLRQMLFCFNGRDYQLTNSRLLEKNIN